MKSAGNDIVALAEINKERTLQFNFYSRIISPGEQELYNHSSLTGMPFENYVWLCWSIKESVYKYLKRVLPTLVFSPTKIIVQNIVILNVQGSNNFECIDKGHSGSTDVFYTGQVEYGSHVLYFRSKMNDKWIASIVDEDQDFENVWWGVQYIDKADYDYQSVLVRKLVLQKLSSFFNGSLTVEKSAEGYPVVMKQSDVLDVPVSLAHHGGFVSYAFGATQIQSTVNQ